MKRIRASTDIKHIYMFAFVVEPTIIMIKIWDLHKLYLLKLV